MSGPAVAAGAGFLFWLWRRVYRLRVVGFGRGHRDEPVCVGQLQCSVDALNRRGVVVGDDDLQPVDVLGCSAQEAGVHLAQALKIDAFVADVAADAVDDQEVRQEDVVVVECHVLVCQDVGRTTASRARFHRPDQALSGPIPSRTAARGRARRSTAGKYDGGRPAHCSLRPRDRPPRRPLVPGEPSSWRRS